MAASDYSQLWDQITWTLRAAFSEMIPKRGRIEAARKDDGSPLSEVDLELQRLLVEIVEEVDEEPCLIAEEALNTFLGREQRCRRIWVIDPLDGTSQFLGRGGREYCVTVTVVHKAEPVACLIYCPELGRGGSELVISVAGRGLPVIVNGSTGLAARTAGTSRNAVSLTRGRWEPPRRFESCWGPSRRVKLRATSLTIDMARTALDLLGSTDLVPFNYFYRTDQRVWDALAGIVVARSSGLVAVDLQGNPLVPFADGFLEAAEPIFPNVVLAERDDVDRLLAVLRKG